MIPADSDVAFFVETCAETRTHIVRNKSAARPHKRAVCDFAGIFFVPEHDIGKSKNLVVVKINRANIRADVEQKHERTLNAEICDDRRERNAGEWRTDSANIKARQKPDICAEFDFSVVNDFFRRSGHFSCVQNSLETFLNLVVT